MQYEQVLSKNIGNICRISLNRPAHRNAQGRQLLAELDDAMQKAEQDTNVNVVILAAEGDHFSAGHDLKEGQRAAEPYGRTALGL